MKGKIYQANWKITKIFLPSQCAWLQIEKLFLQISIQDVISCKDSIIFRYFNSSIHFTWNIKTYKTFDCSNFVTAIKKKVFALYKKVCLKLSVWKNTKKQPVTHLYYQSKYVCFLKNRSSNSEIDITQKAVAFNWENP